MLLLYRPGNYSEDADDSEIELIIAKNRMGAIGKVDLVFEPTFALYREPQYWNVEERRR